MGGVRVPKGAGGNPAPFSMSYWWCLAVHTTVLTTLSALLAALAGLLLTTLMLLTGLALSALLLLAGLALPALLRIALLVLRVARVLLFVRHFDVLHTGFRKPPVPA